MTLDEFIENLEKSIAYYNSVPGRDERYKKELACLIEVKGELRIRKDVIDCLMAKEVKKDEKIDDLKAAFNQIKVCKKILRATSIAQMAARRIEDD